MDSTHRKLLRSQFSFEQYLFPNGLWMGYREVPGADLSLILLFRAGRAYDPEALPGITHLLEHLLLKGTEKRLSSEISHLFETLSGRTPFLSTSYELIDFRLRFPAESLREVLSLLREILQFRAYQPADVEEEKQIIQREIAGAEETPLAQFLRENRKLIYGDHVYTEPVGGLSEKIASFSSDDVSHWADAVMRGPNIDVILVGGCPADEMRTAMEESLALLPGGEALRPTPQYYHDIPSICNKRIKGYYHLPRISRSVEMVFRAPGVMSGDFPIAGFLFSYMDTGNGSRLFKVFREERQICYNFGISCESPRKWRAEHFSVYAADYPPGMADVVLDILQKEIDALRRGDIDEKRLLLIKNMMLLRFYEDWLERLQDRAYAIANARISGMSIEEYFDCLLQLESADLVRFAEKYLDFSLIVEIEVPE